MLLLLLHHAKRDLQGPAKRKDLVSKLSYQMAIELFAVVDMIEIVLDGNRHRKETLITKNRSFGVCQPCLCVKRYPEHISCATVRTDEARSFTIPQTIGIIMIASGSMFQFPTIYRSISRKQAFA